MGRVSGFVDSGIFVEIVENKVEGLVSYLEFDEPFQTDPSGFFVKSRKSGTIIKMGDEIEVIVGEVDIGKREVDLLLFDEN